MMFVKNSPTQARLEGPIELTVLSWNVDGLCGRAIGDRFRAVVREIKQRRPTVVSALL